MNADWKRASSGRGTVLVTLDTEQIWGYLDCLTEREFQESFPRAVETAPKLLDLFCQAGLRATWTVVGALSLEGTGGAADSRFRDLPKEWVGRVPGGDIRTAPFWYARRFVEAIRDALPRQEIGLHGGLTHLCWGSPPRPADVLRREIQRGIRALEQIGVTPRSFTFPRDIEAHHELLAEHGIRCYRGRSPSWGHRAGRNLFGGVVRLLAEVSRSPAPVVWPEEKMPGLWNIPSSLSLYRTSEQRARLAPLASRVARVREGIERAARTGGIFHYYLHPENVTESAAALPVFEEIIGLFAAARDRGDVEVMTMSEVVDRLEGWQTKKEAASAVLVGG